LVLCLNQAQPIFLHGRLEPLKRNCSLLAYFLHEVAIDVKDGSVTYENTTFPLGSYCAAIMTTWNNATLDEEKPLTEASFQMWMCNVDNGEDPEDVIDFVLLPILQAVSLIFLGALFSVIYLKPRRQRKADAVRAAAVAAAATATSIKATVSRSAAARQQSNNITTTTGVSTSFSGRHNSLGESHHRLSEHRLPQRPQPPTAVKQPPLPVFDVALLSLVTMLFFFYSTLVIGKTVGEVIREMRIPCVFLALALQYTYLSALFWLNVINFHVWR